jgi:hypothetical protein
MVNGALDDVLTQKWLWKVKIKIEWKDYFCCFFFVPLSYWLSLQILTCLYSVLPSFACYASWTWTGYTLFLVQPEETTVLVYQE